MERKMTSSDILGYLCDLERKLPRRKYKMYAPKNNAILGVVPPEVASLECQNMLEFAFMEGYRADVKFVPMPDNTAGNTIPGHIADGIIHINIADRIQNNWKVVLATMAHEVCHQVIHRYGIRPMLTWMMETYVDLATIYVGFGQLILNGYITYSVSGNITLGYLTPEAYKITNHIVNVVCGGVGSKNIDYKEIDTATRETVKLWEECDSKRKLLIECFERASTTLAEKQRNIACLEKVLTTIRESCSSEVLQLDQTYFSQTGLDEHKEDNCLAAFKCVHDDYIQSHSESLQSKVDAVETALYHLYSYCRKEKAVDLQYDFICPVCGKHYHRKEKNAGQKSIKCAQCNTHFVINTDDWMPDNTGDGIKRNRILRGQRQAIEYINDYFLLWLRWLARRYCHTNKNVKP